MNTNKVRLHGFFNVLINGLDPGSIVWDEETGLIVGVYRQGQNAPDKVIWYDGLGFEVFPAGIDIHVHDRFGQPNKEDPWHLERACIRGGMGTIFTMPNTNPPFIHFGQLEEREARWRNSPITVFHHIGASLGNLDEIVCLPASARNRLGGVKIFFGSSTGNLLIADRDSQVLAALAAKEAGKILLVHAEDEALIKSNLAEITKDGRQPRITDHSFIRSPEAEAKAIQRAIYVCRETGARVHICHVSTQKGLELIAGAKAGGLPITCETCPHYLWLNEKALSTMGGRAKMNPALRSEIERQYVYACLTRDSIIDLISSDHAPHTLEEKANEEYGKCPSGVPGVQTVLLMVYNLYACGLISAERFIALTSGNAARLFNLNKGELAVGKDADLVLINPCGETTFTDANMESLCGWTPFNGMTVSGSVPAVVLGGKFVKALAA